MAVQEFRFSPVTAMRQRSFLRAGLVWWLNVMAIASSVALFPAGALLAKETLDLTGAWAGRVVYRRQPGLQVPDKPTAIEWSHVEANIVQRGDDVILWFPPGTALGTAFFLSQQLHPVYRGKASGKHFVLYASVNPQDTPGRLWSQFLQSVLDARCRARVESLLAGKAVGKVELSVLDPLYPRIEISFWSRWIKGLHGLHMTCDVELTDWRRGGAQTQQLSWISKQPSDPVAQWPAGTREGELASGPRTGEETPKPKKPPDEDGKRKRSVALQEYVCGPDITPKVLGVLRKIYDDYQSWTPERRSENCSAITERNFPHYEGAWNILQLAPGDFKTWLKLTAPDCCKPRPDCYPTAVFLGQCYHVQVINYVMWGAINTLCGNKAENIRHWLRSWYARIAYRAPQPYEEQRLMVTLGKSFVDNSKPTVTEAEVQNRLQELMTALERDIGSRRYRQCTLTCQQTPNQRELMEGHTWGYYWGKGR